MVRAVARGKTAISYRDDEGSEDDLNGQETSEDEYSAEDEPPPPKKPAKTIPKKVAPKKTVNKKTKTMKAESDEEPEMIQISSEDDSEVDPPPPTQKYSPSKAAAATIYKDDSELEFTDDGEVESDGGSDFETSRKRKAPAKKKLTPAKKKKKATPAKKTPAKNKSIKKPVNSASRGGGRAKNNIKYSYSDNDESENEEEEGDDDEDIVEIVPLKKRKIAKQNPRSKIEVNKGPEIPPVSEMIQTAITKIRDNPKKGSSLTAIKGFIGEEWGINIQQYAPRIKISILKAVEKGDVIQTKGKGASGRFTMPGLKAKKRKPASKKLTKKWDEEQEAEYEPMKRARDEDREKHDQEMKIERARRMEELARKEREKELLPKKPSKPKQTEWVVEMIKGMKVREDKTLYLVKYESYAKCSWEPEENLDGCQDAIENFLIEEKTRMREEEMRRKREEEEGQYEVGRVLEVKFVKTKDENGDPRREFLIRWKGHGEELDSWEPEENLNCPDMIQKFMDKFEKRIQVSEKSLRQAPKKVERLAFANSRNSRQGRRNQGFRITYEDMDE